VLRLYLSLGGVYNLGDYFRIAPGDDYNIALFEVIEPLLFWLLLPCGLTYIVTIHLAWTEPHQSPPG
jgi:hypothetical protein